MKTSKLLLDKIGVYEFSNKRVVANLINELESDVSRKSSLEEEKGLLVQRTEHLRDINFELALVIAGFLLIITELGFIKWRGDI